MQTYSDPSRAADPHALPDVEVFHLSQYDMASGNWAIDDGTLDPGWYYWYCFPGCLPDSDPVGPFESAEAAERAAQEDASC